MAADGVVDWPTLGDLWSAWIEAHCRVPDRHARGMPFREYDYQFWITANVGRIRPEAQMPADGSLLLNQAFVYRRSLVIGPQKIGKGPWIASHAALAAVGPREFDGWAVAGEMYRCEDQGCGCGWTYPYLEGEPKGRRNPSPLIQIAATSEEQVQNIWRPLTAMIGLGPLRDLLLPRGEFIRIVGEHGGADMDRIDRVTAAATSRLGAPISEAFLDETGLFLKSNKLIDVAETMRRGAAGMGGRSTETTNMYNPAQASYAQRSHESTAPDIFKYWRDPRTLRKRDGSSLDFKVKAERRRILAYVYGGAEHINLASIEAECDELMQTDPAQAARFFGNLPERGAGSWLPEGLWEGAHGVAS